MVSMKSNPHSGGQFCNADMGQICPISTRSIINFNIYVQQIDSQVYMTKF